jgi:hypothetical protein
LAGDETLVAVAACGLPISAANNVRKRVRVARARELKDAARDANTAVLREAENTIRAAHRSPAQKKKRTQNKHDGASIRYNAQQVDAIKRVELARSRSTIEAYKKATVEYAALCTGARGVDGGARGIVEKFNAALLDGAKPLKERKLRELVGKGHAGMSPPRCGPLRSMPQPLLDAAATFIQMQQAAGDEQKPREVKRAMKAAAIGTSYEAKLPTPRQLCRALEHVRTDHADVLARAKPCSLRRRLGRFWSIGPRGYRTPRNHFCDSEY